ncbi:shikimate dehydrogenase family protein [Pasteuria penetrans]|uniref:shikimate dehydrogenase family protein n=1 Tax=Pasteuria penetrans TaxID=86005 RepID=UPI0011EC5795|nr:shikimate dehydrogenase [Pasteuria penetrans]
MRLGLLGYPIAHSLSPLLVPRALKELGLESTYTYDGFSIPAAQLAAAWSQLSGPDSLGYHVTAPHKQTIIPLLDGLDDTAVQAQAVNVIFRRPDGAWIGYNTDGAGYVRSLQREWGESFLPQQRVLVLGAGGAAHAIVAALVAHHVGPMYFVNRTLGRARHLASLYRGQVVSWTRLRDALPCVHLVVNATPVGWRGQGEVPFPGHWLSRQHVASDLVYRPHPTHWLSQAQQAGASIHMGLGMFLQQLSLSLELWFQRTVPMSFLIAWSLQAMGYHGVKGPEGV